MSNNTNITIGGKFADRFKIVKCLGVGGMGEVFLATDELLSNSQVALKFLNQELSKEKKQVDRFLREVLLTRQVSHVNVVKTFDASVLNNQLYFVMEYVDGDSLKDLIQNKSIPIPDGISYLIQIAQGLEAIHQAEIIHRDLKPANIMVQKNGQIKIADFGIARPDSSELTNHDEVIGSSHFMSPEAWRGENISYKTDIYSLGIIAFQLFTGQLPYDGGTSAQIMFKHLEGNLQNARDLNPEIPSWLNNLILDLLSTNHELRPELSQVIATLESGGARKRAATKTNLTTTDFIPEPSGYVSESINRNEELSSIWDPNLNIVINKNKTLANPNFGVKNLEAQTLKGKTKKVFSKIFKQKSQTETHWLQFVLILAISNLIGIFALPALLAIPDLLVGESNSPAISIIQILANSALISILASWPILIVDSLFSSLLDALKKHLKLASLIFCVIILLTAFYTFQLNSLTQSTKGTSTKYLLSMLQVANPKALLTLIETGLLLPVASYFEVFKSSTVPAFREIQLTASIAIIPFYLSFLIYISAFAYLIRDSFRQVYQQFRKLFLIPSLFLLTYGLEILISLLLKSKAPELLVRTENELSLISLSLSKFQIYCSIFNWIFIIILLKFLMPLLRTKQTFSLPQ